MRALIVPNLKEFEGLISEAMTDMNENKRKEADKVTELVLESLLSLEGDAVGAASGTANGHSDEPRLALEEKIGPLFAEKLLELNRPKVIRVVLEC